VTKYRYFSESEFHCNGVNCFDKMNHDLLAKLDIARDMCGFPFKITSSWRSEEHNAKIGGVKSSAHLSGNAVDLACSNSTTRMYMIEALLTAGFNRIGVSNRFIHVDVDDELPQNVMWTY
tara:strand:+ start:344 stop:703 length:360 start_codon:yes stop_codon:yes gene_type:complete